MTPSPSKLGRMQADIKANGPEGTRKQVMAALGLNHVHLVGTSLGGWMALEMAVRSTQRLASLTLVGAAGLNLKDVRTGDIFMWEHEERIRNMIHDPALAERILGLTPTEDQAATAVKNEFATARLAWQPRFLDPHLHKWLHRIDVPTQIIWGRHDRVFPLPYADNLHARIPGSRLNVIDDCGHLPHVERPDRLGALISDFVTPIAARGAAA